MTFDQVRTRFAPSPTGYMHVGNLRTALYAYLLAKKNNGTFILRIEDTDQERYVEGAVDIIYNTLRQTGLLWDEGPDIGGPVGPYIQSQRMGMFKDYALQLIEKEPLTIASATKKDWKKSKSFSRQAVLLLIMTVIAAISPKKKFRQSWTQEFLMLSDKKCHRRVPLLSTMRCLVILR